MEKTYGKVTLERQTGYRVVLTSSSAYSSVEMPWETMYIDMSGDVMYIDHDSSCYAGGGFCTYRREDPDFRRHVRYFMERLLEKDLQEFKKMFEVLTGEWHAMAESVRKHAASKYEF